MCLARPSASPTLPQLWREQLWGRGLCGGAGGHPDPHRQGVVPGARVCWLWALGCAGCVAACWPGGRCCTAAQRCLPPSHFPLFAIPSSSSRLCFVLCCAVVVALCVCAGHRGRCAPVQLAVPRHQEPQRGGDCDPVGGPPVPHGLHEGTGGGGGPTACTACTASRGGQRAAAGLDAAHSAFRSAAAFDAHTCCSNSALVPVPPLLPCPGRSLWSTTAPPAPT